MTFSTSLAHKRHVLGLVINLLGKFLDTKNSTSNLRLVVHHDFNIMFQL